MNNESGLGSPLPLRFDASRAKTLISVYHLQDSCLRAGLLTRVYTVNQMSVMTDQDLIILKGHYRRLFSVLTKEV